MMVDFLECRMTWGGEKAIIDVKVKDKPYLTNITIKDFKIDNQDTFIETGPSSTAVKVADFDAFTLKTASVSFNLKDYKEKLHKDDLLFVWVTLKGTPSPNTPCGEDVMTALCVLYDEEIPFKLGMGYIKDLSLDCEVPMGYENWLLLYNAFKLALDTGNYMLAIELWKKLKGIAPESSKIKGCGCHG